MKFKHTALYEAIVAVLVYTILSFVAAYITRLIMNRSCSRNYGGYGDSCYKFPNYNLLNTNLEGINCILVDEVQFMPEHQIKELWMVSKLADIPVVCYGLKTNFKGELFEGSKAVLEVADELEELATICSCGKKAKFNARLVKGDYTWDGAEVAIDGIDASYEPLCGECYMKKVLKKTKLSK